LQESKTYGFDEVAPAPLIGSVSEGLFGRPRTAPSAPLPLLPGEKCRNCDGINLCSDCWMRAKGNPVNVNETEFFVPMQGRRAAAAAAVA
jgi:hypothetical protein